MLEAKDRELEEKKNSSVSNAAGNIGSRKRNRFQLDDSDSDGGNDVFVGFTHKGRPLTG